MEAGASSVCIVREVDALGWKALGDQLVIACSPPNEGADRDAREVVAVSSGS
jgi:hypothetical protein